MSAVATAAIAESAADSVGATRIGHAARSRARALVAREAGDGRETAVAAAATPRPRVESRSTHVDGSGGAGVTMCAVATAAIAESAADAVGATRIGHAARSLARARFAREVGDGRETAGAAAATPRLRVESRSTHDDGSGGAGVTMGAVATAAIVESAADAVGATRIGHAARSLARTLFAREVGDGRETAVTAAATPRPRVESRSTHDDGGGSVVVTIGAVATAAIVESAADAVGATRIGHAARSLARALLARKAGDGRETAVAAAATPRPRVESRSIHGDGSGGADVTMGAVATAAIAESAADAVGATRIGHAARSLARALVAREAGDGREMAVAAAATPRLRVESRSTHDDGGGSVVVTMDAVATAAIVESVADAVGATRIGHAARSLARTLFAREVGDGRETAVTAAATPRPRVESRNTHDDGGGSVVVTIGAVATAAIVESAADAVGATSDRIGHAARSLARALFAREVGDGRETAVAAAATPRLRVESRSTHDDGSGGAGVTMCAVATAAIAESAADAVGATRIGHAARSLARTLFAREVGDGRETAVAAAATPRPRVESCSTHDDGGGSAVVTMGAVATAAIVESAADAVGATWIEHAARSLARALVAREAGDGRETAVSAAATPRPRVESRNTRDDGGGSVVVTIGAVATAAIAESAADAVGATRIEHAARSPARVLLAREAGDGRATASAAAATPRPRAESRSTHDDGSGGADVMMGAVATAAIAESAADAVGATRIGHAARSLARVLLAREVGDGRETAVPAAATPRPRVESRSTHDDGSGGAGVTITVTRRRKHSGGLGGEHAAGQAGVKPRQPSRSVSFPLAGGAATVAPPHTHEY